MQSRTDEELMLRVKQGQLHCLGELFERHHLKLFNFFLKFCGNRHWSEDMVQNIFLKMLKYASSYRDTSACLAWMFSIARNVALDYLGAEKERSRITGIDPDAVDDPRSDLEYLEELKQGEKHLQLALLRLPVEKLQLVLLSKLHHISMVDLAAMYECTPGTMNVRIHRALEELREYYSAVPTLVRSGSGGVIE